MTKTISQLWKGELDPLGHLGKDSPEIRQLERAMEHRLQQLERAMEHRLQQLEKHLDEKAEKSFEKYNDCVNECILTISRHAFGHGFSLGTRLAAEALLEAEQMR